MRRKKLGFALGAGGSRGVAHIGFLRAMEERGIRPDFIAGSSMGAVVGACYAAGMSPARMHSAVRKLKFRDIASFQFAPFRKDGLLKMEKARKFLADLIGEKTFADLAIPFVCVATDLERGKTVVLDEGDLIDAALASASIPGVFSPAKIGNYAMLSDGGILERVPAEQVKNMGAEAIVAVDVLGNLMEKKVTGGLVNTFLRYIDIIDTRNTVLLRAQRPYVSLWLEPDLGGMDQYRVKNLEFAYKKGYETGKTHAEEILRLVEG